VRDISGIVDPQGRPKPRSADGTRRAGNSIGSRLAACAQTGDDQTMAGKGGRRSTSWEPGRSGNPRGRPKVVAEVRDLARHHTSAAIGVLTAIMNDPKVAAAARVTAATAILDRGWGKPQQPIDADINVVPPEVQERRDRAKARVYAMLERMAAGELIEQQPAKAGLTEPRVRPAPAPRQLTPPDEPPPPTGGRTNSRLRPTKPAPDLRCCR
jgi:uncharacterized protein DUF5681